MDSRVRQSLAPAYLFLCLILGGSAQGVWANMILQLIGVAIIAWAAIAQGEEAPVSTARQLLVLTMAGIAFVTVQLIALPASIWTHLPGREAVAEGFRILGTGTPPQPLSLVPQRSFSTLLCVLPPIALFCAIVRLKAYRPSWLVAALVAGTCAGILLGAVQVATVGGSLRWYPYAQSSFGTATGFFANGNHMGILLVASLPFLAALFASARGANRQRNVAIMVSIGCLAAIVVVGIALNRSLAAYGLVLPVLTGSALILLPQRSRARTWVAIGAAIFLVVGIAAVAGNSSIAGAEAATSVSSREEILSVTSRAIRDFMPWGSGLGSFEGVYHLYEDRGTLTNVYVNHAHNDYAETALELGLPGILLMIAFLAWWARAAWGAWSFSEAGPYARGASIASAAILAHSIVDFPLRTAAIASLFAMCLALLVERRTPVPLAKGDLWRTRHVVLQ